MRGREIFEEAPYASPMQRQAEQISVSNGDLDTPESAYFLPLVTQRASPGLARDHAKRPVRAGGVQRGMLLTGWTHAQRLHTHMAESPDGFEPSAAHVSYTMTDRYTERRQGTEDRSSSRFARVCTERVRSLLAHACPPLVAQQRSRRPRPPACLSDRAHLDATLRKVHQCSRSGAAERVSDSAACAKRHVVVDRELLPRPGFSKTGLYAAALSSTRAWHPRQSSALW